MADELDDRLHRSGVHRVGGVRVWIESVGHTEPFIHLEGDRSALDEEENRALAAVLKVLTDLAGSGS